MSPGTADVHERLAGGAARLVGDDPSDTYRARIVPIPEGETTTGLSGIESAWPRETLKEATERGVWGGVTILKGPGGTGHFDLDEQPPVENLAGKVVGSSYSDGVGPVLEADLIDEKLARAVEADLVSVSPDLSRELADDPDGSGPVPVERLRSVAYITVLDTAASTNATIEPAHAEALGMHPDELGPGNANEATQDRALSTFTVFDVRTAREDETPNEYLARRYDLDAREYDDKAELLADVRSTRSSERDTTAGSSTNTGDADDKQGARIDIEQLAAGRVNDAVQDRAESAFVASDFHHSRENEMPAQTLARRYNVDAREHPDVGELRAAVRTSRGSE